jgi:hypothetical protein
MEYKSTLKEDLGQPLLNEVERGWIRKPVTIILTIMFIIPYMTITAMLGMQEFFVEFTIDCWKGPTSH